MPPLRWLSMPSFSRLLAGTGLALTLITPPLQAFAATPQQHLQQALRSLITHPAQNAAQGTLDVRVQKTPLRRGRIASTQSGTLEFSVERETEGARNLQGWVRLNKATNKTAAADQSFTFSPAPQVDFRSVGDALFLRPANLAPMLSALQVPISGEAIAPFERWIRLDASSDTESSPITYTPNKDLFTNLETIRRGILLAETKNVPVLQILSNRPLRTGSPLRHLKVRVNPAFVNLLEQEALKLDGRDATKRRATQTLYREMRMELAKTQLAVVMDTQEVTHPTITRIEFFTRDTTTKNGCDYTRFQRTGEPVPSSYRCALPLERVITETRGGINLLQKTGVRVEPVTEATPLNDLVSELFDLYLGAMSQGIGLEEDDASTR